ncbi:MAG: hypothetical protein ACTSQY_09465 [Candidatus Odinarchaeia archaeon]
MKNTKRGCHGSAYLNGTLMTIYICTEKYLKNYLKRNFPKTFTDESKLKNYIDGRISSPLSVAGVFIHELQHTRRYEHRALGACIDEADRKEAKEAIGDFEFTFKQPKRPKPREDLQMRRYNHVLKMISDKERQLKRLQNQLKKWKQKRKYYENVLLAAGKIKKENNA